MPIVDFEIGVNGKDLSFQGPFPESTPCCKCQKPSPLAFVVAETGGHKEGHICLQKPEGPGFWIHDAAAFATYLCRDINCTAATTLWNQA